MATNQYTLPSLPCALPTTTITEDIDLVSVASQAQKFLSSLTQHDFLPDAIWRDSFALTGTLRTFYSAATVFEVWSETSKIHHPGGFSVGPDPPRVMRLATAAWVEVSFRFETEGVPATTCSGFASMAKAEDGSWKIWVLRTILEGLKGQPSVDVLEPLEKIRNGTAANDVALSSGNDEHVGTYTVDGMNGSKGSSEANGHNSGSNKPTHYGCVIIGGGQAGLSTGGRLQALGVSYVILESHAQVGDNWKTRYDSTKRMFPKKPYPYAI